jgi:arabinan endo-1,5-alpha-L-arabinosidase
MIKKTPILTAILFVFLACGGEDEIKPKYASVALSSIGYFPENDAAVCKAKIIDTGGSNVTECGFCWSNVTEYPSETDNTVKAALNSPDFEAEIANLQANSVYFVRAYAVNTVGISYSEAKSFSTKNVSGNDEALDKFVPPAYSDDYSSVSSWDLRSQWNLANVHDPSVERCGEYYYMYGTDASYGNAHLGKGHFPYRRSRDLVNWEFCGTAMPDTPAWVKDSLNSMRARQGLAAIDNPVYGYWAPVVRRAGTKYRMYYSIVIDNYIKTGKANTSANFDNSWTERAFIGLCETNDLGSNIWSDKGMVAVSATDKGNNWSRTGQNDWNGYFKWNAIDPTYLIDKTGEHYLIYGSWHSGIVSLKINAETGKPETLPGDSWNVDNLPDYGARIYTRNANSRWQGSEGAEIIYNPETGYYYLFLAYDELSVAYNTRVCRSLNIEGPYAGFNGQNISNGGEVYPILTHPYKFNNHSGWVGISHCGVFRAENGEWFYASQARLPANTNGNAYSNAIMMGHVRKIRFTEDGWPVVMPERFANVPDVAIAENELVGTWENITLKYSQGNLQTSQTLVLNENKTASGALSGAWDWDAGKKILTVGSTKLYVEREVDWEASPRRHTIVYAGLNGVGESVWGKRVN